MRHSLRARRGPLLTFVASHPRLRSIAGEYEERGPGCGNWESGNIPPLFVRSIRPWISQGIWFSSYTFTAVSQSGILPLLAHCSSLVLPLTQVLLCNAARLDMLKELEESTSDPLEGMPNGDARIWPGRQYRTSPPLMTDFEIRILVRSRWPASQGVAWWDIRFLETVSEESLAKEEEASKVGLSSICGEPLLYSLMWLLSASPRGVVAVGSRGNVVGRLHHSAKPAKPAKSTTSTVRWYVSKNTSYATGIVVRRNA